MAGFVGLLRDENGRWVFGFKELVGVAHNLLLELMAICMGLKLVWEHGFIHVHCENDSLEVIRLIPAAGDYHCYDPILAEIRDWVRKD